MVNWRIGEEFKPAKQLKTLYYIYFVITIIFAVLIWYIPVVIFAPLIATVIISIPVLLVLLFTLYWIPKFYGTISYKLDDEEIEWRRGVWFKNTGIIPYNRITNVDIAQGPISRMLDIGSLKIQTAGYSNPNQGWGTSSEITIDGVEDFEELRHIIMDRVKGRKPVAVQTFEETPQDVQGKILAELVEIKKLLQKISEK
ncbi:MAG: PH domain-containing protein [Methanobacterium sp.]|nr:PH domain-containing protein [Methanobacterium sp.]MBV1755001.1 PH domain-containing protein [Methanobacterium sp.]MBV1767951.1 PH domain-containing protein [Methanobacterium sp.]